ncbi:MAG: IclR family transcriptional regulator [Cytobacillus gottheilii]|uniref:IclR family transcriptional regulator n=1 Tax=Cytobacillus gottheilii TaxID=859144 RepID=UPI0008366B85|nr:IclR family transcriptional regulator [Cytobacillus gottheilii]
MANVQSLERALTLLNVLSEYPNGIQITRLAEQVGLSKSTVHRLLSTLIDMNYVSKDTETDKYKIGFQIIYISRNVLNNIELIPISKPFLKKLSSDVNETIHLCMEDKGEVVYIDKIESNQTIRMYSRIGSRAPMYCTGVGKVLLSGKDQEQFEEIAAKTDFITRTENTIRSRDELKREVETIRAQGYALDNIENEEGIRCIAAPIYDYTGKIIASFSISGPSSRITMQRIDDELQNKVQETSRNISKQLGYRI